MGEDHGRGADDASPGGGGAFAAHGRFLDNLMHFGRLLRQAGLPVGPGAILDATRVVEAVGVGNKRDFYWALHTVFVQKREHHFLFDAAFAMFWRDPFGPEAALAMLSPRVAGRAPEQPSAPKRIADALSRQKEAPERPREPETPVTVDMTMTYSAQESLRKKDFADMSADEVQRAKALIARMRLPIHPVPTRRFRADPRGPRVDLRATLRASLRTGGTDIPLSWRSRRRRIPPLVVLCDVSGSMDRYSRMLLHFLHALTSDRERVHAFVFGTRLSNVTRALANRDVDVALARVGADVDDWSGGTNIGRCLHEFNQRWSRRVLGQGAVVLLISDGLDRAEGDQLEAEVERLQKSCRRLIWLNPLLGFEGFEPRARGVKQILPHVDDFRSVHDLESLEQLVEVLSEMPPSRRTPAPRRGG